MTAANSVPLIVAAISGLLLVAAAALMFAVTRRAAAARDDMSDQAESHGWRFVRSHNEREGDFHIEGASSAGAAWTITRFSITADSHRSRLEFRMPSLSAPECDFAIGSAQEVAKLPQLANFTEQHSVAGSLIHMLGSMVGGPLALVSDGVVEPTGSPTFQQAFGAVRSRSRAMPLRLTPDLEQLFLSWPDSLTDPSSKVTAWRDKTGLRITVMCPSSPPWDILEHLAQLGESLGASLDDTGTEWES